MTAATRTVVLVPWRPAEPWRVRSWEYVRRTWHRYGLSVVTGDVPGAFNRSAARNAAARAAGPWEVGIFGDADTFVRDPASVLEAARIARETGQVVQPHDTFHGLTALGSRAVLGGDGRGFGDIKRTVSGAPLGIIVVPRAAWDRLGGFDERFDGWGGEDVAFTRAARTLVGLRRIPGTIWHLWHPNDAGKLAYIRGPKDLLVRYRDAQSDPAAMAALIAEGRS